MAFGDIMHNIFGTPAPTVVTTTPVAATPGNIPTPAAIDGANPGVVPVAPAVGKTNVSPLDQYSSLWETPTIDPNAPEALPTSITLTQEQVAAQVANTSFTDGITPEILEAISAGGPEASAAFLQAMNNSSRQVLTQATLVGNKLADETIKRYMAAERANMPELIRATDSANQLSATHPALLNPAVKPIIDGVREQFLAHNPNATPAEINAKLTDYVVAMGEAFNPPAPKPALPNGEQDFSNYLS